MSQGLALKKLKAQDLALGNSIKCYLSPTKQAAPIIPAILRKVAGTTTAFTLS
jgi:hypothetical protein